MLQNSIKNILLVGLLLVASCFGRVAYDFDIRQGFASIGYSGNLDMNRHMVDLNAGLVVVPDFCRSCEIGLGLFHMQLNFSGDHQVVSDDELLHLGWFLATMLPLGVGSLEYNVEYPVYIAVLLQYLWNGYVYVPLLMDDHVGIVNKNRLVTQVFSEGFSAKAVTFQDDIGARVKLDFCPKDGREHSYCACDIDFGVRLIKNFAESMDTGLFFQVGI